MKIKELKNLSVEIVQRVRATAGKREKIGLEFSGERSGQGRWGHDPWIEDEKGDGDGSILLIKRMSPFFFITR